MCHWYLLAVIVAIGLFAPPAAAECGAGQVRKLFDDGQHEQAAALATELLERDGADTAVRLIRARALTVLGQYDAALRDIETLLRAAPRPDYYGQRAAIRFRQGLVAEGFADLVRMAELDRDEVRRATTTAAFQMIPNPAGALKTLDDAIALHPKAPELYARRADVQHLRGHFDRALTDARTARDLALDDPHYYAGFASMFLRCNRAIAARAEASAALARFPGHGPLYEISAKANLELGRPEEAVADALRCLELAPASGNTHLLLARCRVAAKQYGEAALDYQTAAGFARKERPHFVYYRSIAELSRLLSRCPDDAMRDGRGALRLAEEVQAVLLPPGESLDTLASAYAELGQFDKAVKAEEQALRLVKGGPEVGPFSKRLELYKQGKPCRE